MSMRLLLKVGETFHKFCRIWFGKDGSYYVGVPYHSAKTAFLFKTTVDYSTPYGSAQVPADKDWIDDGDLDDDEHRLKLSHHRSGFCQFSGEGVLSGIDETTGKPRGMAIFSRALEAIGDGPAFAVNGYGFSEFQTISGPKKGDHVIDFDRLIVPAMPDVPESFLKGEPPLPIHQSILVEGFYFQPKFRDFINAESDGSYSIFLGHPSTKVLKLVVVLPDDKCEYQGFIGLWIRRAMMLAMAPSGFALNGPGENFREDSLGRPLGDTLHCIYPRPNVGAKRSLNYAEDAPPAPPPVPTPPVSP